MLKSIALIRLVEEKRRVLTLARESIRRLAVIDSVAW